MITYDHIEAQEALREFIRLKYVEKKWCKPQSRMNLQKRGAWNCTALPNSSLHSKLQMPRCPQKSAAWKSCGMQLDRSLSDVATRGTDLTRSRRRQPKLRFGYDILSRKLTYFQKIDGWKTTFLLTWWLFSGHVNFGGVYNWIMLDSGNPEPQSWKQQANSIM